MGEPIRGFGAGTAQPGKVLVIVSSARVLQLSNGKTPETGHFLIELTQPLQALIKAGYHLEFASPTGEAPHIDPLSNSRIWFVHTLAPSRQYQEALDTLNWLKANTNYMRPLSIDQLGGGELNGYKAVVFPGGHAPMVDLWNNPQLGIVLRHFHNAGKPIGAICHGPIALLSTLATKLPQAQHYPVPEPAGTGGYGDVSGCWPFRGYRMCCYSDAEEMMNETMWRDKLMFKAEHELRRYGGRMDEGWPMVPHVVVDKELVTGQGPTSADKFGKKLVQKIQEFDARGSLRV